MKSKFSMLRNLLGFPAACLQEGSPEGSKKFQFQTTLGKGKIMKKLFLLFILALTLATAGLARAGGPVVLMGIDAEDGGVGGHGPISVYQNTAQSILTSVTKPTSSGILVIGGVGGSQVQTFWNALGSGIGQAVTFANGANISTVNFASFALLGVASDFFNTPGGLTDAENALLAARASDIAAHINSGGGLLGFSNCALAGPYAYLGSVGAITCASGDYSDITPTTQGTTLGITDALDVCCWHDQYATFPSFLNILATIGATTGVAAIGGAEVVIPGFVLTPPTATNLVGTTHTVTIEVTQTTGGVASPIAGITVSFAVSGVNTTPALNTCQTDAAGKCTFTYTGLNVGLDTITATATVLNQAQTAAVTKTWTTPPFIALPFDIKPTSCRNPLNAKVNETAVLPAAILGFTNLDVTLVNPASVRLEGVPALRWSLEDVATPFVPFTGKLLATDCTTGGPDGFLDLSLKFNNQMIINALGGPAALTDGQVVVLHMTGNLFDNTAIKGEDVVVIIKKK